MSKEEANMRLVLVVVVATSAIHHFGWWDGVGLAGAFFALYDALLEMR